MATSNSTPIYTTLTDATGVFTAGSQTVSNTDTVNVTYTLTLT